MADTGAPYNIPFLDGTEIVRDYPQLSEDLAEKIVEGLDAAGDAFDAVATITTTDAAWPVPTLGSPIVKVTVIGGGGGGGGAQQATTTNAGSGGNGGTTTFGVGSAFETAADGGTGGTRGGQALTSPAQTFRFASNNGGMGGNMNHASGTGQTRGANGYGGEIVVAYVDLDAVATVDVAIGAGGSGGGGSGGGQNGAAGGAGVVLVEYKAG